MKKMIESIKKSRSKQIMLGICALLIISVIISMFVKNAQVKNTLTDPDKAVDKVLEIFYTDKKRNEKIATELLDGKTYQEYFGEMETNSYTQSYNMLKELEGDLIKGKDAVTLANEYTEASLGLLKKVKSYQVVDKQEISNGYRYTIEVIPSNTSNVYKYANECAVDILGENGDMTKDVYYYCLTEGMKKDDLGDGTKTTVSLVVTKQEKTGYYIPDVGSLMALVSAVL